MITPRGSSKETRFPVKNTDPNPPPRARYQIRRSRPNKTRSYAIDPNDTRGARAADRLFPPCVYPPGRYSDGHSETPFGYFGFEWFGGGGPLRRDSNRRAHIPIMGPAKEIIEKKNDHLSDACLKHRQATKTKTQRSGNCCFRLRLVS